MKLSRALLIRLLGAVVMINIAMPLVRKESAWSI